MINVIQKHNSKILKYLKPTNNKIYSCQQKSDCPLNQNFLSECLVYNAVVNYLQQKITTELVKKVSKRDITITRHHLDTNHIRKVLIFLTVYGN